MKNVRKFVPALAMLVVSALMLTTASFAWFAMNTSVAATGMQVNVKSDSIYLQIAPSATEFDVAIGDAERAILNDTVTLPVSATGIPLSRPTVMVDGVQTPVMDIYPTAHEVVTQGSALKTPGNWYTASGQSDSASGMVEGSKKPLVNDAGNTSDLDRDFYMIRYKYFVRLASGSSFMDSVVITSMSITPGDLNTGTDLSPVRVVVACGDAMEEFSTEKTTGTVDFTGTKALGATDDTNTVSILELQVYVYYDGNDNSVTTKNVPNLSDAVITFTVGKTA